MKLTLQATFLCLVLFLNAPMAAQDSGDLAVVGGHYFDTDAGDFVANKGLLIKGGKFAAINVEEDEFGKTPVIKLDDDHYILPGLIDCHAHYNVKLFRNRREEFEVIPIQYLANGVTVTFSCGEYLPEQMWKLRQDIETGAKKGPRLLNSGPYFGIARRP